MAPLAIETWNDRVILAPEPNDSEREYDGDRKRDEDLYHGEVCTHLGAQTREVG